MPYVNLKYDSFSFHITSICYWVRLLGKKFMLVTGLDSMNCRFCFEKLKSEELNKGFS